MKNTIALILILILVLSFPNNAKAQATSQPQQLLTTQLTLNEWNIVLGAINSPDDVTKRNKDYVVSKIIDQLNKQIALQPKDTTTKPKTPVKKP